jgi:hypothetical protein
MKTHPKQAILTRYFGPTNTKPSRIKATAQAGSVTLSWNYDLDPSENHRAAALALAAKFDWTGPWQGGALPANGGFAWTCPEL